MAVEFLAGDDEVMPNSNLVFLEDEMVKKEKELELKAQALNKEVQAHK